MKKFLFIFFVLLVENSLCEEEDPRQVRLLLTNDFEDGFTDPWQDTSPGSTKWIVEELANSTGEVPEPSFGSKYLRATKTTPSSSGLAILRSPRWEAQPGDEISLTFWIRSRHLQANILEVYWIQNGIEELLLDLTSFSSPTNFEWRTRKAVIPITVPSVIELVIYGFCGSNPEDAITLDDITVGFPDPITTTPSSNCGSEVTDTSGSIISPNYPFPYNNLANCIWQINVPENYTIELTLVDFSTQLGHDFLRVYDGSSGNDPVLLTLTGDTLPPGPVYSSSNFMRLQFIADGDNIQARGFYATFNVI